MKYITPLIVATALSPLHSVWADEAPDTLVLPGAVNLQGIGNIYGVAGGVKHLGKHDISTYVAVATGDAEAFGLAITDIPFLYGKLSYAYAQADGVTKETHYRRGASIGTVYDQDLSGNVHTLALTHALPFPNLTSTLGITKSTVSLDGYALEAGGDISINESGLGDIDTTSLSANATWDTRDGPKGLAPGSKVSTSLVFDLGRSGQSSQGQVNYQLSHHISTSSSTLLSLYVNGSHAFILSKASDYDTDGEVRDALDAQCDTLSANEQHDCLKLERDLVDYIVASNNEGTALAVGGSQGLRSYQESFFRGRHSLVEGAELQWRLPDQWQFSKQSELQWVAFIEDAQVADEIENLTSNSQYSVGTGVRAYIGDVPARLEFAHGKDGNALLLTAGLVF